MRSHLLAVIALSATTFACWSNIGGGGSGGGDALEPTPYVDLERCWNEQSPPAGHIRIDSKAGYLAGCTSPAPNGMNVFIFTRYDTRPVKTQLEVCADQVVPAGWVDVSGSYHAAKGCDYRTTLQPGFANARLIYRKE
jgi:hypothetical protein